MELAGFDYEDKVEIYYQIVSHTYSTQEAQIQRLEQMNIRLCEECIMLCNEHENDENEIEFGELKATEEIETTSIYYQSIYTHCKQQFEIRDEIIAFKKTLFQYIENQINNYLFGNYNITIVKRDFLENILHYSNTESENIIATKDKKITDLPEDFTSLRSPTRQQKPLQTSSNLLDFLAENQSEHSETAANEENNSEITEEESIDSKNEEDEMTTYIAKILEFNGKDIETSPQE
ncbi:hypothetical protein G9A89_001744 [Geosiphon pyriformis]|nr:hypothetical protein G9A89_001744 [Geosiphon pyriformis]